MAVSAPMSGDYRIDVLRVAVIGGIGSGKTAVTDYLRERGAVIVDADLAARRVVEVGEPAYEQLRDAFGDAILSPDRTLDRAFVAEIAFSDPSVLRRLNQITHAAIGRLMAEELNSSAGPGLAVVALPLFRPEHREALHLNEVWCVVAPPEVVLARLTGPRGLTEADARARLEAQMTSDERLALADVVITNDGSLDDLRRRVDVLLGERKLLHA